MLFGRTHGTEIYRLDTCLLATPLHLFAAEVGSFFITTAHRKTSYLRTVVVCFLVISSSESTKTSSPAVGDKMAQRSRMFPLSTQSFLFVFLLSHLFSRDIACLSRNTARMDFSRHTTRRRANSARTALCGPHRGKHKQLAFAGLRSEVALSSKRLTAWDPLVQQCFPCQIGRIIPQSRH